jgi:putative transposase
MANYRRAKVAGGIYFFTVVTHRRKRFLCSENVRSALRDGVQATRMVYPFDIDAWVLLPDHLHCVWTLPPDDANFGIRWAMIKRFVSKRCGPDLNRDEWMNESKRIRKESAIWQRRFWEHMIRDERDFEKHVEYIHYNPVKHNWVPRAVDWPYSTFHRYVRKGLYSNDWGGGDIVAADQNFGE